VDHVPTGPAAGVADADRAISPNTSIVAQPMRACDPVWRNIEPISGRQPNCNMVADCIACTSVLS
jgi:hypothetical protein